MTQASLNVLTSNRDKEKEEVQSQREQLKQMEVLNQQMKCLLDENVALKKKLDQAKVCVEDIYYIARHCSA